MPFCLKTAKLEPNSFLQETILKIAYLLILLWDVVVWQKKKKKIEKHYWAKNALRRREYLFKASIWAKRVLQSGLGILANPTNP